jgi:glutathione synthase/RimK-type ligase-like ATP-grasp enzyme
MRRFAVVTHEGDLHALMVRDSLRRAGDCCAVIASDALAGAASLSWYLDRGSSGALCRDIDGGEVSVAELDLVWWRRNPRGAAPDYRGQMPDVVEIFEARNIRAALLGLFLTDFEGVWVDPPESMRRADNKLVQLRLAAAAGLRVPRTLLSQDPERIRAFAASLDGPMIVKTVSGMLGVPSLTGEVTPELLREDGPLMACPALYQELIPGRRHIRAHGFGGEVRAALIESDTLDWRHPLAVDVQPYPLSDKIKATLLGILQEFELQMGIFDLKLADNDEPIWLELNPQGQFLFIEALGGGELIEPFARFLQRAADRRHSLRQIA